MLLEVYYKYYMENCRGRYWEMEEKSTPYMVLVRDFARREAFKSFLESRGFRCVTWNREYPGVLVNPSLMRFALIDRACKHGCVDDRSYTLEEFFAEVLQESLPKRMEDI